MSNDHSRSSSTIPFAAADSIPRAPPLPAPRPLQRARDAATRLFGYQNRPPSPQGDVRSLGAGRPRFAFLSGTNATASHKTGLAIKTIAINEAGTHALLGGKEIFKTVRVEDGSCIEDLNLRSVIRSTPTQASGRARQVYAIDIADVAWAKGDCGNYVAAATSSGKIILYDLRHAPHGLQAVQLHEHARQVHKVTFNPFRGNLLLSGSQDGTVRLWDLRDVRQASTLKSKHKYSGQADGIRDVKWSPTDGVDFAFGTDSGYVQQWDMRNLKTAKVRIPAHTTTCNTIDWHADGKHIVSASSDKTVRVWDFSVGNRRQKASWEIKTPYPVLNARWRPSCESSMPNELGARQCTQLVTAYDASHPVFHIWDYRRPNLPFREVSPYPSAPTDLLWHSQDLLWTVGREGIFLQVDIQHASKVIDKRNLQAFAVSAIGDINLVTQRRQRQHVPKGRQLPTVQSKSTSLSHSPDHTVLSRSWADDSIDHSFLSMHPDKGRIQSDHPSRTQSFSMGTSSDRSSHQVSTVPLSNTLSNRKSFRPMQAAYRGILPGGKDVKLFTYLARQCEIDPGFITESADFVQAFEELLESYSQRTQAVNLFRLAQSWRIINFAATNYLTERTKVIQERTKHGHSPTRALVQPHTLGHIARNIAAETTKSAIVIPTGLKPVSSILQQLAPSYNASDQLTPLAKPVADEESAGLPDRCDLSNKNDLVLPPPVTSTLPLQNASAMKHGLPDRRLTSSNLDGLQKLQQGTNGVDRADIVHRWSIHPKEPLSLDPVDSNGIKIPPKLEKRDSDESFAFLCETSDSRGTSFPSSFASAGSCPLQMVAERPSRTESPKNITNSRTQALDFGAKLEAPTPITLPRLENSSGRSDRISHIAVNLGLASRSMSIENTRPKESRDHELVVGACPGSYPDENGICPLVEVTMAKPDIKHSTAQPSARDTLLQSPTQSLTGNGTDMRQSPVEVANVFGANKAQSPFLPPPLDDDIDIEGDKPFTLVGMLRELVNHYAGKGEAQTAAQMLLLLGPILPRTHSLPSLEIDATVLAYIDCYTAAGCTQEDLELILDGHLDAMVRSGLQPLQTEAILESYHDQLMRQSLLNEAAVLRKLSYPAFPAVYDQSIKDNSICLRCGGCGKPISSGMADLRCENCGVRQAPCPVCLCEESPFDANGVGTTQHVRLLTACLICNHGGHATCLRVWFDESQEGDGGCPTQGCLCDCVAGAWRAEKEKMAENRRHSRSHSKGSKVMSDDWSAQESKAVQRTRAVLRVRTPQGGVSVSGA
ncbi:SEA (Seh1-associated) complex subunit [Vermiconidia calcicola]|uniref:SEA (Seh1-associated) complex subunit n=1 Tax=Vermiconidia calcicola TaxID=1690605 RepID=A0ACC3MDD3_9PEZI|nr:SEA (Seh1-associated) complex subunit [Vermiconidia calcicola]